MSEVPGQGPEIEIQQALGPEAIKEAESKIAVPYLSDFFRFLESTDFRAAVSRGENLTEIMYEFCGGFLGVEQKYNQQWIEEHQKEYESAIKEMEDDSWKQKDCVKMQYDGYWEYLRRGNGVRREENVGRIYINYKPEKVKELLMALNEAALQIDFSFEGKLVGGLNRTTANRTDKMLIYFNEKQSENALKLARALAANPDLFHQETTAFTMRLKDEKGDVMPGIGFGANNYNSFSEVRAKALAELYGKIKAGWVTPESWAEICENRFIDVQNPAFSTTTGKEEFAAIREAGSE